MLFIGICGASGSGKSTLAEGLHQKLGDRCFVLQQDAYYRDHPDLTFEQRTEMLHKNPEKFREEVDESLKRHFKAVKELVGRGTYFFDYGNAFMKAIYDAGVSEISRNGIDDKDGFIIGACSSIIFGDWTNLFI